MTLPISVVIPCYKQEQYLERAIESAWNAGAYNVLVFQDDYLTAPKITHPRVVKFNSPFRAGVCYGRNMLIQSAQTDLIFCLDADDRLYPDALERMFAAWTPGTWTYGDSYTEIDEGEAVIREMKNPPPGMLRQKNLCFSTFLFHRDDWAKVGGYDCDFECLEEDYALQCALVNAGVKPVRIEGAPIYRRMIHTNSRTAKAMRYWNVTLEMCKDKFPGAFVV